VVTLFFVVFAKLNREFNTPEMRVFFAFWGCPAMHIMHAHARFLMHVYYAVDSVVGSHDTLFLSIVKGIDSQIILAYARAHMCSV
jgi:hypothetical protein